MPKLSPFRPAENVLISHESSFYSLGMDFDPAAPYAGCRICGAIYQSVLDREAFWRSAQGLFAIHLEELSGEEYFVGDEESIDIYVEATERRTRWRELHARRYHTQDEVDTLLSTGWALTPEAAHKLAPYGFAPLGNMHDDIIDAMATAPRAPIEDAEN